MFLRKTERRKNGKTHLYWSVVENRRLDDGRVVQRHVLYLGEINSSQAEAWRRAIEVFDEEAGRVANARAVSRRSLRSSAGDDVIRLRLSEMRLCHPRQWGACWLAGVLWRELRLDRFWAERLPKSRKGTRWDHVLQVLATYRLISPGSEWRLHRQWFLDSAMADLLGSDFGLAEAHKLYACHDLLLAHKQALFSHLTERWRDLFNASFDVLLYDLTSTYFEVNAADLPEGSQAPPRLQPRQAAGLPATRHRARRHARRPAARLRGSARQHRRQQDAAFVPRQDRKPIRQGAARLGDGSRRADRGGSGRNARQRSAGQLSRGNAEGPPQRGSKSISSTSRGARRARASRSSC
jgi:hypothetical protein